NSVNRRAAEPTSVRARRKVAAALCHAARTGPRRVLEQKGAVDSRSAQCINAAARNAAALCHGAKTGPRRALEQKAAVDSRSARCLNAAARNAAALCHAAKTGPHQALEQKAAEAGGRNARCRSSVRCRRAALKGAEAANREVAPACGRAALVAVNPASPAAVNRDAMRDGELPLGNVNIAGGGSRPLLS